MANHRLIGTVRIAAPEKSDWAAFAFQRLMKQQKFWTTRQLARLRECYPTMPQDELLAEFAPHSLISIRVMAHKLKVRRRRDWAAIANQHVPAFTLS